MLQTDSVCELQVFQVGSVLSFFRCNRRLDICFSFFCLLYVASQQSHQVIFQLKLQTFAFNYHFKHQIIMVLPQHTC